VESKKEKKGKKEAKMEKKKERGKKGPVRFDAPYYIVASNRRKPEKKGRGRRKKPHRKRGEKRRGERRLRADRISLHALLNNRRRGLSQKEEKEMEKKKRGKEKPESPSAPGPLVVINPNNPTGAVYDREGRGGPSSQKKKRERRPCTSRFPFLPPDRAYPDLRREKRGGGEGEASNMPAATYMSLLSCPTIRLCAKGKEKAGKKRGRGGSSKRDITYEIRQLYSFFSCVKPNVGRGKEEKPRGGEKRKGRGFTWPTPYHLRSSPPEKKKKKKKKKARRREKRGGRAARTSSLSKPREREKGEKKQRKERGREALVPAVSRLRSALFLVRGEVRGGEKRDMRKLSWGRPVEARKKEKIKKEKKGAPSVQLREAVKRENLGEGGASLIYCPREGKKEGKGKEKEDSGSGISTANGTFRASRLVAQEREWGKEEKEGGEKKERGPGSARRGRPRPS